MSSGEVARLAAQSARTARPARLVAAVLHRTSDSPQKRKKVIIQILIIMTKNSIINNKKY